MTDKAKIEPSTDSAKWGSMRTAPKDGTVYWMPCPDDPRDTEVSMIEPSTETDEQSVVREFAREVVRELADRRDENQAFSADRVYRLAEEFLNAERELAEAKAQLASRPEVVPSDSVSFSDIRRTIEHIHKNGVAVERFGGSQDIHEGRCRQLCAMYLEEMMTSARLGKELERLLDRTDMTNSPSGAERKEGGMTELRWLHRKGWPPVLQYRWSLTLAGNTKWTEWMEVPIYTKVGNGSSDAESTRTKETK